MLLSIIIPVYNLEDYIARCLDSCLRQELTSDLYEIICVNDGSTDNSVNIIQEYMHKDKRVKLVNKVNGGVSSARNKGLEVAHGEYVWFVDGDDWISSYCVDDIINNINKKEVKPDTVLFLLQKLEKYEEKSIDISISSRLVRGGGGTVV